MSSRVTLAQASIRVEKSYAAGHAGGANCPGVELLRDLAGTAYTACYTVTNNGSLPLASVVIADTGEGLNLPIPSLAPGQTVSAFLTGVLAVDRNSDAIASGTTGSGAVVTDADRARIDVIADCPTICYIVSDVANNGGPDNLYRFDATTGATTLAGATVPNPVNGANANCLESLTFSPPAFGQLPTLYSVDAGPACGLTPANSGFLGTLDWDPANGVPDGRWTPLPNPVGIGRGRLGNRNLNDIDGLDFDPTAPAGAILYGAVRIDNGPDLLIQIDPATGSVVQNAFGTGVDYVPFQIYTNSAGQVLDDVDDLAVDPLSGQMWGIANDDGSFDELVQIDKLNGVFLNAFPLLGTNGVTRFQDMEALNFDPVRGELYGSSGSSGGATANSLFRIQRTGANPGRTELVSAIPGTGDYEGSDCFPSTPDSFTVVEGTVFWDLAEDGNFGGTEATLADAVVELWIDVNGDSLADEVNDFLLDSFVTGPDGRYSFIVPIGQTFVVRMTSAGLPASFCSFTTPLQGPVVVPELCGVNEVGPDFGITTCRALGDFVWDDLNQNGVQDPGEAGVPGVGVELLDSTGNVLTNTVTGAAGSYLFTGLASSNYVVRFSPPSGWNFTAADAAGDDALDSDALPGGLTVSVAVTNRPATGFLIGSNLTVDAGIFLPSDLAIRKTTLAAVPGAGDVTFDYALVVTNAGLRAAVGLVVSDTLPSGLAYVSDDAAGVFTPANRTWSATVPSLAPGSSATLRLRVAVTNAAPPVVLNTACVAGTLPETTLTNNCSSASLARLGDRAWEDLNGNGIQDPAESTSGLPGVAVTLLDASGVPLASTVADSLGNYAFAVPAGTYRVAFTPSSGYSTTAFRQGADPAADSDANPLDGGRSALVTLAPGDENLTVDAGFLQPASLGDRVWLDANANGVQDPGEAGLDGVTVNLLNNLGAQIATTTTTNGGQYAFTGLAPGDYRVEVLPPVGTRISPLNAGADTADSDIDPVTRRTAPVTLVSGQNDPTQDAGLFLPAALGDFVWNDLNGDGVQDAGEPGLDGVTVNLLDNLGAQIATTATTNGGQYAFTGLNPGVYSVEFVAPAGFTPSPADRGGDEARDSDVNPATGRTAPVTLVSGQSETRVDAGLSSFASLGNFVWEDANANGLQDPGEPGLDGVTVSLFDGNGALLNTTVTTNGGLYAFTGLLPGTHAVGVVPPASYSVSPRDAGADTLDSDLDAATGRTAPIVLAGGENNTTLDAGLWHPASLGDFVWEDRNGNGVQDPGEAGVDGVTVNLLNGLGAVVASTVTTNGGQYAFTGLTPGEYAVAFVPGGTFTFAPADQGGNDGADSDANPATGRTPVTTLSSGEVENSVDAGVLRPASLGDFVWLDANANGIQDAGEVGLDGVTVNLLNNLGAVIATTTTTNGGQYGFTGLAPGDYRVEVLPPVGARVSPPNAGLNTADSDVDPVSGRTVPVTLVSGQNDPTRDAGLFFPAALGDFVWQDLDGDGVQDAGEPGLDGVTVNLLNNLGALIATTTTTNGGQYAFTGLVPGAYTVEFVAPAGFRPTAANAGGDEAVDSDAGADGRTSPVTLASGASETRVDAGLVNFATIRGQVRDDVDGDGNLADPDAPIPGVTVALFADTNADGLPDGAPLATALTDSSGNFVFTGVPPGAYVVVEADPVGFLSTADVAGANDNRVPVTVLAGQDAAGNDFLDTRPASLGNRVWVDDNGNGIQDAAETTPVANVPVILLNASGLPVATNVTSAAGDYLFTGLVPGVYSVRVVPPAGARLTAANIGADESADSDASAVDGITDPVTLGPNQVNNDLDAGLFVPASLSGQVREDADGDGDLADPDAPIPSVTVSLFRDDNGDGIADGPAISTITTDGAGNYRFDNLVPGRYLVVETDPAGFLSTRDTSGPNDNAIPVTLVSGATSTGNDFLDARPVTIGDRAWTDLDADGVQDAGEPGLPGVIVTLFDRAGTALTNTVTGVNGGYLFTGILPNDFTLSFLPPGGHRPSPADAGGDDTADSDANAAGLTGSFAVNGGGADLTRDAGFFLSAAITGRVRDDVDGDGDPADPDAPVSSVTVELFPDPDCNGTPDGAAIASTLTNAQGDYSFTGLVPACYVVVERDPPGTVSTYDRTGPNDNRIPVTLVSGQTSAGNDFLDTRPGLIGNLVWEDLNGNGLQEAGEPGVPGVSVELIDRLGNTVQTTTTSGTGVYVFTGVMPGDYAVRFVPATLPAGFRFTPSLAGDDTLNSDADPASGLTRTVTLTGGQVITTLDAGAFRPVSVGDTVWRDLNGNGLQDPAEPGVPGVTVRLLDSGTLAVVGSLTTGPNGEYRFSGLTPGDYTLELDGGSIPVALEITAANAGAENLDSDVDPVTGLSGPTGLLVSGTVLDTLDAGLVPLGTIGDTVWLDVNRDGVPNEALAILGIPNVRLELYSVTPAGTTLLASTISVTNAVNRGFYSFTGLRPGVYEVRVDVRTLPRDFTVFSTPALYRVTLGPGASSFFAADFGLMAAPTAVDLVSFTGAADGANVILAWTTGSETDNLGFQIYRSSRLNGARERVNATLVEGQGSGSGADYAFTDSGVPAGVWYYWLEDVEMGGKLTSHGPARVTVAAAGRVLTLGDAGWIRIAAGAEAAGLQLELDGTPLPAFADARGNLLAFAPAAGTLRLVRAAAPARLPTLDAAPAGGDTMIVVSEDGNAAVVELPLTADSMLATGFAGTDLVGFAVTENGLAALANAAVMERGNSASFYASAPGRRVVILRVSSLPAR